MLMNDEEKRESMSEFKRASLWITVCLFKCKEDHKASSRSHFLRAGELLLRQQERLQALVVLLLLADVSLPDLPAEQERAM